jgi:hypothetical protein
MKYVLFTTLIGLIIFSSLASAFGEPEWSDNTSVPPDFYDPFFFTRHQITWNSPTGIDTALIEINYTGSYVNYTMTGMVLYEYNIILPAGTHCWNSYANNSIGQWNSTLSESPWCYTIQKQPTTANLYLNGTAGNVTYNIGNIANFSTLTSNVSGIGDANVYYINLTSDYPLVNASNNSYLILNQEHIMGVTGTYWLNASFSGNENYTSSEQTHYFTISSAVTPVTRSISIFLIILFVGMLWYAIKNS